MEDNKKEITYRLISAAAAAATPRNKTNRIYSKKCLTLNWNLWCTRISISIESLSFYMRSRPAAGASAFTFYGHTSVDGMRAGERKKERERPSAWNRAECDVDCKLLLITSKWLWPEIIARLFGLCILSFPYLSGCRHALNAMHHDRRSTTQCQLSSSSATVAAITSLRCHRLMVTSEANVRLAIDRPENHTSKQWNCWHKDAAAANEKIKFLPSSNPLCQWKRKIFHAIAINYLFSQYQNWNHTEKSETARALIPLHRQNWAMRMNFSSTHPSVARAPRWQMFAKFLTYK